MPLEILGRMRPLLVVLLLFASACATDPAVKTARACDEGQASECPTAAGYAQSSNQPESVVLGYYEKGCAGKDARSCNVLGALLSKDTKDPKRLAAAAEAYRRACDAQDEGGCERLSQAYLDGEGVEKSAEKARALVQPICARAATISETTTEVELRQIASACLSLASAWSDADAKDADPVRAAKLRILAWQLGFEEMARRDQDAWEFAKKDQPMLLGIHQSQEDEREERAQRNQTLQALATGLQQASATLAANQAAEDARHAQMNSALASLRSSPGASAAAAGAGGKPEYKVIPGEKCSDRQVRDPCLAGCGEEDSCETRGSADQIYQWGKCTSQLKVKGKNPNGTLVYDVYDPGYRSCVDQCVGSIHQCRKHCPYCAGDKLVTP